MPTISDVAKLSGLSKATVSRVINNYPHVSEEKKQLVKKAMEELGYHPNPSARRLRGHLTSTIGVIIPRIINPFFSYLVNSIEQAAYDNNYQVLIFQSNENKEKELYFLDLLKTKQVDGIIMASIENKWEIIKEYMQFGPIVLCNEYVNNNDVPMVRLEQRKGAYLATKHLIDRGHRKIGYCTGGLFDEEGKDKDRNQGYQKALIESGIPINPNWIFVNKHSIEDGKQVLNQILMMDDRPTAVFTGSDEIAGGVIVEAKEKGLNIPDDIAIIGFDDQPQAEMLEPKLTTVRQPVNQMGAETVRLLIELMSDQTREIKSIELPAQLIIRETT